MNTTATMTAQTAMSTASEYISYAEASALLAVPESSLRRWVREQRIPHLRLGPRTVRFRLQDLVHWLAHHEVASLDQGATDAP